MEAIFSRYDQQCIKCACYIKNTADQLRKVMDDLKMECSNDNYCQHDCPCEFFVKKWKWEDAEGHNLHTGD